MIKKGENMFMATARKLAAAAVAAVFICTALGGCGTENAGADGSSGDYYETGVSADYSALETDTASAEAESETEAETENGTDGVQEDTDSGFEAVTVAYTDEYSIIVTGLDFNGNYAFAMTVEISNFTDTDSRFWLLGTINGTEYTFDYVNGSTKYLGAYESETYTVFFDDPNFTALGLDADEVGEITVRAIINGEGKTEEVCIFG